MVTSFDYKKTLHLPHTDFPMRANLAQREPAILAHWQQQTLYLKILEKHQEDPLFLLHDGPPYANGQLHQGHILNKILKDMVIKDRSMAGYRAIYIPGWDCHGLPIEVQVDKVLGSEKGTMAIPDILQRYRQYAAEFMALQGQSFQRLGVLGLFEKPYCTMAHAYEAETMRQWIKLLQQGLIYRSLKPVNWCMRHQTALAEAEVDYQDKTSPSAYVRFHCENAEKFFGKKEVDIVIWTTTPWTLSSNVAIAVHPDLIYVLLPYQGRWLLLAQQRLQPFLEATGIASEGLPTQHYLGKDIVGLSYKHCFLERQGEVYPAEYVTCDSGTGCVHTAPGHGPEDYELALKYQLDVLSPVNAAGFLTSDAGALFAGLHVFKANAYVLAHLKEQGFLLNDVKDTVQHRYAHCWRCHEPIILRATHQWFMAMDKPYGQKKLTLRQAALEAIADVKWIPTWGIDRIQGMLGNRPDWCLSRQRLWGVPLGVVYCDVCNEPWVSTKHLQRIADAIAEKGVEAWYDAPIKNFYSDAVCSCGGQSFHCQQEILDVWFDSGSSYAAVLLQQQLGHQEGPYSDLYLEGSDQHRGWFHSSLLLALAVHENVPYRAILTHGFVVDGQGKKISKSKGNFVDPFKTIEKDGAEILRLWVASEDFSNDIRISQEILNRLSDMYRKIRNTIRYLLANLSDFDPEADALPARSLRYLDLYMLGLLQIRSERILNGYQTYQFHKVLQELVDFCNIDLSSFYLDILKDCLYTDKKDSEVRRSAQTAMYAILHHLLRLAAPILAFTCEEAWQQMKHCKNQPTSVHLASYNAAAEMPDPYPSIALYAQQQYKRLQIVYEQLRYLRTRVNEVLEQARRNKVIGSSTEAAIFINDNHFDHQDLSLLFLTLSTEEIADNLLVSSCELLVDSDQKDYLRVLQAEGTKCPRCWLYRQPRRLRHQHSTDHPDVCERCEEALNL